MNGRRTLTIAWPAALGPILVIVGSFASGEDGVSAKVDFNRHIRPLLSEKCFRCHGPDQAQRKASLRLDEPGSAQAPRDEGPPAISPGQPMKSQAWLRITSEDEDQRMPPVESGLALNSAEREVLKRWIEQGAKYDRHWALVAPLRPPLPPVRRVAWPRNAIDQFVLARLEREDLTPAPEAAKAALLRRVTLDLTGLPPTLGELDEFLADEAPDAYERRVDRLLASPRYGERMAVDWLDAARFADTNGYFSDFERPMWPWRDWVIRAFNSNLPFDQFTIEQLGGDLLSEATVDQRIATGFHRNHPVTNETGAIDEEYRVEYVADRVDTTGAVWLGLTLGCARCHDHKYDPVSQREYYQLFAFFNNGPEMGVVPDKAPPPVLPVPAAEQQRELEARRLERDAANQAFEKIEDRLRPELPQWQEASIAALPSPAGPDLLAHFEFDGSLANAAGERREALSMGSVAYETGLIGKGLELQGTQHVEAAGEFPLEADQPWTISLWFRSGAASLGCLFSKIEPLDRRRGVELLWKKGRLTANLVHHWGQSVLSVSGETPLALGQWQHVALVYDGSGRASGLKLIANGAALPVTVEQDSLTGPISNGEPFRIGRRDTGLGWYGRIDEMRIARTALPERDVAWNYERDLLRHLAETEPARQFKSHREWLLSRFLSERGTDEDKRAWQSSQRLRVEVAALEAAIPATLVMQDMPKPRETFILERGQYDRPKEPVAAGVPECLPPLAADLPRNRLGLARWLVDARNPLTARVAVNRAWQLFFGLGLVKTPADFGSQGDWPSHLELLDELAVGFVESDWDLKALHRTIVLSATYRQSAAAGADNFARDPENRLLARGPRNRLSGEMLRDQALAASGLLVERLGGPSVKPYQPPGLWEAVSYDGEMSYEQDHGANLYRRSLYTFWKRQAPPPAALVFDGPARETCAVRRQPTNTPLQALVLLNDPTYVEAARALATRLLRRADLSAEERVAHGFRRVAGRDPDADETARLRAFLARQLVEFRNDPTGAENLLTVGEHPRDASLPPAELAAWTTLACVLFNLDEVITKP